MSLRGFLRRFRPSAPPPPGSLRLHLGCGRDPRPGYVNIDRVSGPGVDVVMDFARIAEAYAPESAAEVLMVHSLAYLGLGPARDLFRSVLRVLAPGGRFVVETPDLGKCCRRALESEGRDEDYIEAVRGLYAFDLDQVRRREIYPPYAFGWSAWHLRRELEEAGFVRVVEKDPETHGPRPWRDLRMEAEKP